jgi:hypothetical protein
MRARGGAPVWRAPGAGGPPPPAPADAAPPPPSLRASASPPRAARSGTAPARASWPPSPPHRASSAPPPLAPPPVASPATPPPPPDADAPPPPPAHPPLWPAAQNRISRPVLLGTAWRTPQRFPATLAAHLRVARSRRRILYLVQLAHTRTAHGPRGARRQGSALDCTFRVVHIPRTRVVSPCGVKTQRSTASLPWPSPRPDLPVLSTHGRD